MSFESKVVIVTGASSGIGAAAAQAFSAEGAKVVLVARNESRLNDVAARCPNSLVLRADLAKDDDVRLIVEKTIEKFGQIDVLINNAAVLAPATILSDNLLESYDIVMGVNLRAIVYLTNLAAPHIIKHKGNIINISSIAGSTPPVESITFTYNVSKGGLNHFTVCAASELAAFGVRVNGISPGPVVTNFLDNNGFSVPSWDRYKAFTALNRVSEAKEVADLAVFLASDKAKAITGVNHLCDNGMTLQRKNNSDNK